MVSLDQDELASKQGQGNEIQILSLIRETENLSVTVTPPDSQPNPESKRQSSSFAKPRPKQTR